MENLLNLFAINFLSLAFLMLGYKIYQKGLKDGLSIKKDNKISYEKLIEIPKIKEKKTKSDEIYEAEQAIFNNLGTCSEKEMKILENNLQKIISK